MTVDELCESFEKAQTMLHEQGDAFLQPCDIGDALTLRHLFCYVFGILAELRQIPHDSVPSEQECESVQVVLQAPLLAAYNLGRQRGRL